jgi:hypothetical protein
MSDGERQQMWGEMDEQGPVKTVHAVSNAAST